MLKSAIITDSTAYLPSEFISRYDIHVLPLTLHWEDESFADGVDISPAEFYTRLAKSKTLPKTSQVPTYEFLEKFNELAQDCDGIIVVLLSSGISGTVDSARAALENFDKAPVAIIDTRSTSAAQAMVTLAAARAVEQGCDFEEVGRIARETVEKLRTYFAVDTLEFLHRGGRIGGASRYLGAALQIKPILCFDEAGKIEALERVRTRGKALRRLISLAEARLNGGKAHIGVLHANCPAEAGALREQIAEQLQGMDVEILTVELSPVIGAHVGPGAIGIAVYSDS
jgi:DegV family protein with EDD domain